MSTTTLPRKDARPSASRVSFPHSSMWHAGAPAMVVEAAQWGPASGGWKAWQRHLLARKPASLGRLLGRRDPLLWGVASLPIDRDDFDLLRIVSRAAEGSSSRGQIAAEQLEMWLRESVEGLTLTSAALECLAWAHALPALARFTAADRWWELLSRLLAAAYASVPASKYETPLAQHWLQVELPLTLAWLLPEISPCRSLAASGVSALEESLSAAAEDLILPGVSSLPWVRPRVASWLRALAIARQLPQVSQPAPTASLRPAFLHALRLTCPSGRQVFDRPTESDRWADLFKAGLAEVQDPAAHAAAGFLKSPDKHQRRARIEPPPAAWHSEQAALGILRRNWAADGEMLAVSYGGRALRSELVCGRETFWSGAWTIELRLDGKALEQRSDWDHVCWVSDADTDYLEVEARFTGGVRVQRQMLLARQDRLLYVADAILGQTEGHLEYRGRLPLEGGIQVQPAAETREMSLVGRRRLRVQPLALPEWRCDGRGGSLVSTAEGLELCQQRPGRRLYAPLLIDLDPRRAKQPLTWRQLTVAEDRQTVRADVAVGYRAQIGRQQWLIYRALSERANRTLLGTNLVSEFLFARFNSEGEAASLLEIE